MSIVAIILAGGSGERYGEFKQFVPIHGKPVLAHTVEKFEEYDKVITVPGEYMQTALKIGAEYDFTNVVFIRGGKTRQRSVQKALQFLDLHKFNKPDNVIITDANRPLITKKSIWKGMNMLESSPCVVSVCKTINTVCTVNGGYKVLSRENMFDLLMPQFFRFKMLYEAHEQTFNTNLTDDSQIIDSRDVRLLEISFWEGLKLTYPDDYKIFELLLEKEKEK